MISDPSVLFVSIAILALWLVFEIVHWWCKRNETPEPTCQRCGSRWHTDCFDTRKWG